MRKILVLIIATTIMAAVLSGCSVIASSTRGQGVQTLPAPVQGPKTLPVPVNGTPINNPVPQPITVNILNFEKVDVSSLPAATQNFLEGNKNYKGFCYWQEQDVYYIAIFAGEKPTGGYQIEVKSVEDTEGITNILVEESSPNGMATQVITYPYTVIKVKGITENFNIVDTEGNIFSLLRIGC